MRHASPVARVLDLLARSALWHAVGRLIYRAPVAVVLVVVLVAALWLVRSRWRNKAPHP